MRRFVFFAPAEKKKCLIIIIVEKNEGLLLLVDTSFAPSLETARDR